ncbi:MAG: 5-formyltetrahydrofolate cyclo-ligase [Coxiellaceae bacterium]|nr:MAG: 5-formyltetrahydrofolate cyclo-ligase [Coxiellaceae bacterium]
MDRQQLRRQLLAQRRQLSPAFMQHAASQISQQIVVNPIFLRSHRIAFYLATKNELDPTPLLVRAWEMGKQCYLPILHPLSHNKLWFAPYHPNDRLVKNHYGILQPTLSSSPLLPAWALNLVIVPMVGFDSDGNRLGMGKGYYDRTFAFKNTVIATNLCC